MSEPTEAQMSCGFCLYGPPAYCTCGTCMDATGRHKATCYIAVDEVGEYINCYRPLGGCDCGARVGAAQLEKESR
jgi:hypothetical protein